MGGDLEGNENTDTRNRVKKGWTLREVQGVRRLPAGGTLVQVLAGEALTVLP